MKRKFAITALLALMVAVPGAFAFARMPLPPTYPPTPVVTSGCPQLSLNLYMGLHDWHTGGQVTQLQQFLNARYGNQLITGFFGPMTYANVARFQQEQSVYPITGGVGPLTRAAIARVCGVVTTPPTPALSVTSPTAGQVYTRGNAMPISWSGLIRATLAYEPHASIVDLYTAAGVKVGTIAIGNSLQGNMQWNIPTYAPDMACTMQYPNGLCGQNLQGQYYIVVTAVVGNGFESNPTVIATAQSGIFTIQ